MSSYEKRLGKLAVRIPEVLLPRSGVDLYRWAVIACDQHTSDLEYWRKVEELVGDSPSTLHLVLPEVYLEEPDLDQRIERIRATMRSYLEKGVLTSHPATAVYLERSTGGNQPRRGLMLAFDLERYDFSADSRSLIRATEQTIVERLPPRVRIRDGAPLEFPHIMILVDDSEDRIFGHLLSRKPHLSRLYDSELMLGGGHLTGYAVTAGEDLELLAGGLERLADAGTQRYGGGDPLLFAMGDGNHSFATAKQVWERLKRREPKHARNTRHPARFALAELVNLHDPALEFEPIHRVVFDAEPEPLLRAAADSPGLELHREPAPPSGGQLPPSDRITVYARGAYHSLRLTDGADTLAAAVLQRFLDAFLRRTPDAALDYIHGADEVARLVEQRNAVGFLLPEFDKTALFPTVAASGPLPRKCFSLGEAYEKRYYLEGREIL